MADSSDAVNVAEVTSSGLTHDCTDGGIPGFVCKLVWRMSTGWRKDAWSRMYIGKNFGTIQLDWETKVATVTVRDESGAAQLKQVQRIGAPFQEIGQQEYPVNLLIWSTRIGILISVLLCIVMLRVRQKKNAKKMVKRE